MMRERYTGMVIVNASPICSYIVLDIGVHTSVDGWGGRGEACTKFMMCPPMGCCSFD